MGVHILRNFQEEGSPFNHTMYELVSFNKIFKNKFFIIISFKGTVRPDWICMRVVPLESPLKGHQTLYVFDFLISVLNIWNNFKVLSRFMQNWTQSPACSVQGLHRMLSFYWLAHFHLMTKSAKVELYFGSGCRMMKFFTCEPQSKEHLMPLPHLWNTVWRKRSRLEHIQTVNRTSRRIRGLFAWSGSELWSCFKNSRSNIKIENI